uniref:EamA domain-containing protein n=1 Tax=Ditylum brightwellii TaxID=49249 RepID=A0A7S4R0F9_9STRA
MSSSTTRHEGASKESDPLLCNTSPSITIKATAENVYNTENNDLEIGEAKTSSLNSTQMIGRVTLAFVAFLYGTLNVSLRMLYALPNPPSASALSTTRGWLAAFAFLPFAPRVKQEITSDQYSKQSTRRALHLAALELALWNFGAQGLLNVGLLFTDAARAAFFTQTSVVMTPLLSYFSGGDVRKSVWLGCFIALMGLIILSSSNSSDDDVVEDETTAVASSSSWFYLGTGDIIVLAGAASWSMYIFRVSSLSQYHPEVSLQAFKTIYLACMYTTWFICSAAIRYATTDDNDKWASVLDLWRGYNDWKAWLILFYSAAGPGTIADILQQGGQKYVSASEANVILCGEPVFTALLSRFVLHEIASKMEYLGGSLIILAAILASI